MDLRLQTLGEKGGSFANGHLGFPTFITLLVDLAQLICGPIWGSFAVRDHLRPWDHLRTRTVIRILQGFTSTISDG